MTIAFIGTGIMGETMISAILREGIFIPSAVHAYDVDPIRLGAIEREYKIDIASDIHSVVKEREIIVLSIKPQSLHEVMKELKGTLKKEQLVISIVAGAKIDSLSKGLGHDRIVRVMPNTPAQVGEGMSVWTATESVSHEQKDMVQTILRTMGKRLQVPEEKYVDMATAVSGSGPAYVFLIIEALTDAGVHIGFPRDMSAEIAMQTISGSVHMARESEKHPAELKNEVTSPGGTTAEGLLCLEEGGIRALITQAVIAGYEKAQYLGNENVK